MFISPAYYKLILDLEDILGIEAQNLDPHHSSDQ